MNMQGNASRRIGVVAVVARWNRLLVIRRSRLVSAPGMLCFPGGGIEAGESQPVALRRELREELAVDIEPQKQLWESVTSRGVRLFWWQAELDEQCVPVANPAEVDSLYWMSVSELRRLPDLLESNHHFLDALESGVFTIDGLAD